VIADCIGKGDLSAGAMREYDREIERQLGVALDRNYGIKEYIRKASDAKLDRAMKMLKMMKAESIPCTRLLQEVFMPGSKRAAKLMSLLVG
jgi:hypothetical protein